jgi:hypothetical protein
MKKKLIQQIRRLCEKQYRKGFQQGFYSCMHGIMTKQQVDQFRTDGSCEDYSDVVDPITGRVFKYDILSGELAMPGMDELSELLNSKL